MSTEERLTRLNRAARVVVLIEAWHQTTSSPEIWTAVLAEARGQLEPQPGAQLSTALIAALADMDTTIRAAEAAPHTTEGEMK